MIIKKFDTSGDSLNGIIKYLHNSFKENYETYVSVKASSTHYSSGWREDALIIPTRSSTTHEDNWASLNQAKQNFTVYFHKHVIDITKYSFRTQSSHGNDHPKTWTVEGSMDGRKWRLIDEKKDRTELCGKGKLKTYTTKYKGKYSYFRFTQTGTNSIDGHYFDLGKVEFFGTLCTKYSLKAASLYCRRKTLSIFRHMIFLVTY